jgi:predicted Ser/Thr protein kinase/tetratricopeptide (TPR) repeat protein
LKLGRYEVVRELGKGAMGIVYLAKDPLIGRLVALKTIRPAAHADDDETKEFQQRFIREAQAAGILNHPNIVTVHDIGQDEPSAMSFIAMEFVEGPNLKEILSQGRTLTFEQIGDIAAQVADALDFAHSKGIVHRDVKPANIIIIEGNRAKITDFGIAKIASGGANLTSTGQFLGTPNYMAPEQIKGANVDGRTDIFSLGICLYELLTRRKPFGGDSLTSISYKIVHEPFPPLQEINPQIPDGYSEVVGTCLAKDPAKRYQRARDLAAAIRAVARGERPVRPADPVFAEETVLTRDGRDRIPTVDMPFPESLLPTAEELGSSTRPAAAGLQPGVVLPAPAKPRVPGVPVRVQVRKTLTNVRTHPAWRRRIPAAIFIAVVGVLVAGLFSIVVAARTQKKFQPPVDRTTEARTMRERQLRIEANQLVQQGRITDAYAKFAELDKLSPGSPYVAERLERLDAVRMQQDGTAQQQAAALAEAKTKLDEGIALFNQKKYTEAYGRFQESFNLNPSSGETVNWMRQAQIEEQRALQAKAARRTQTPPGTATDTTGTAATSTVAVSTEPAQLTTFFNSQLTDGEIIVKAGAEDVLRESLYQEQKRRMLGTRRIARVVNVTRPVTPKNADLQIWVVVPSLNIREYHIIPVRLVAGGTHRLVVTYNAKTKLFDYQFN